ncbi:immunoglobulin-like domain-containing receptor 1a isoform X1 [Lampris incognitus]|uniref:immunoglobulin-like domain-containing receptor 1a isoform X1 n=1 Tax=Lampris incognitus TaxID=2546036 RepID=UPI0024B4D3CA|nr:immunoglobulin-like domain-containing receptor 1a isoform X1 [Lampris incognitus]
MATMVLMAALLFYLSTETLSIQVIVPETERSTALFASVILRCDYSTSANPQEVLVTWRYKSFCKDPVLEYYSTAYQAALQLGQDPANDCPDRQRTLRTVIQKRGSNEAMLGSEYRERKITMQNKADLVITEVMWWDNGVYFCSIDAPGDTTGDSDREVKLIVYHWLTVLFIIIGALLLIMLFCICCCQCCPQKCCCYVRCPCCPQTCCCPEKVVMQHRMLRDAQKAMTPWLHGQPIYAPISSNVSSQGNPILYSGSISDHPAKQNFAMAPMGLSPVPFQQQAPPPPPPHRGSHRNTSAHGSVQETNQVLDYLESQMRGMDGGALQMPLHSVQHLPPMAVAHPPQPLPHTVPFTSRPPSMLSALDEMGLRGVERRVITLPPIVQHGYSLSPRRGDRGGERARGDPRISSQSSGSSNRTGVGGGGGRRHRDPRGHRNPSPPQHGLLRGYSDDSEWESQRNGGARGGGRPERGGSAGRRGGGTRPRSRSRDDLMEDLRRVMPRRDRSYSPPLRRQGSWSSDDDDSRRGRGGKGREWSEKPPSYSSIELKPGRSNGRRTYDRFSDRSSRSGTSVVI